jgi:HD-GYP domain-containing protein (c-di-GMP phosphodiesterase class II)
MRIAGGRCKKTMPVEEATNELIRCAGKQFDPEVVQAFVQVMVLRKELGPNSYNKHQLEEVVNNSSNPR